MSRTLTTRPLTHPHNRLRAFTDKLKCKLRQNTTVQLKRMVDIEVVKLTHEELQKVPELLYRHQFIAYLVSVAEASFKAEWKKVYGWDFDDVYDALKFQQHVRAIQNKQAQPEGESKFPDPHAIAQ